MMENDQSKLQKKKNEATTRFEIVFLILKKEKETQYKFSILNPRRNISLK